MTRKLHKKFLGFTLIETMVAISILSISILGTFTAVQSALQNSTFAKDQITAFYLVQEAIEFIRNTRDSNNLAGQGWLKGISAVSTDACYFGKTCYVDIPGNVITTCNGSCPVITQDVDSNGVGSGLFGYGYTTPTHFKREVFLQQISITEVIVNVKISWTSGVFTKSFQVQQTLMNWQ